MISQKIETIKKRYHREWLLIAVDKTDKSTTTPISGALISHSPHRDEVYKKLINLKKRKAVAVTYSEDEFPEGCVACF